MSRRLDRSRERRLRPSASDPDAAAHARAGFNRHRQWQAHRARVLGCLLIPMSDDYRIELRRAPDVAAACRGAWGEAPAGDAQAAGSGCVVALRELLGIVGAWEWRRRGIPIESLGEPPDNRIHPHYGVFAPTRSDYLQLLAQAAFPAQQAPDLAIDVGTGTGVLAAMLARRGVARILATEVDPRALACARENLSRLGLLDRVQVQAVDMFPPVCAPLVVCNPPWIPARPGLPLERAIYDEGGRMLSTFLAGLADHLAPNGQGWLILSDLAERLGLRTRTDLLAAIDQAGLQVIDRSDIRARHPKAADPTDPLHDARSGEIVSLWRLAARAADFSDGGQA